MIDLTPEEENYKNIILRALDWNDGGLILPGGAKKIVAALMPAIKSAEKDAFMAGCKWEKETGTERATPTHGSAAVQIPYRYTEDQIGRVINVYYSTESCSGGWNRKPSEELVTDVLNAAEEVFQERIATAEREARVRGLREAYAWLEKRVEGMADSNSYTERGCIWQGAFDQGMEPIMEDFDTFIIQNFDALITAAETPPPAVDAQPSAKEPDHG